MNQQIAVIGCPVPMHEQDCFAVSPDPDTTICGLFLRSPKEPKFSNKRAIVQHTSQRAGDVRHSQADIVLAKTKLGFEPTISFDEGIRQTISWYTNAYDK